MTPWIQNSPDTITSLVYPTDLKSISAPGSPVNTNARPPTPAVQFRTDHGPAITRFSNNPLTDKVPFHTTVTSDVSAHTETVTHAMDLQRLSPPRRDPIPIPARAAKVSTTPTSNIAQGHRRCIHRKVVTSL
jgi:hypothetical protein